MSNPSLFKIAVSAFIVRDNRLLILKRSAHETFLPGVWEVPGGGIDEGEAIEDGVKRETWEEAGLHVTPKQLFGFFEYLDGRQQKTVNLNFICALDSPSEEPRTGLGEMIEAAWATLEELDQYPFTSRAMLEACKEALSSPS